MKEYKMTDIWKLKLQELRLQEELMRKDSKFTKENLHDLRVIIEYVKKEYAKALEEEMKENSNGKKL